MRSMISTVLRGREAQSLIEAALLLPVLLVLTFNAANMGYMFWAYLNMATASRQGAEYSIQGVETIPESNLPTADAVKTLVYAGFGTSAAGGSSTPIRVCAKSSGLSTTFTGAQQIPLCTTYGTGGSFPTDPNCTTGAIPICPDPEASYGLILNRVDVQYTVTPLIDGAAFNLILPAPITFHRFIYMRNIG